jgi:hypothetical protein
MKPRVMRLKTQRHHQGQKLVEERIEDPKQYLLPAAFEGLRRRLHCHRQLRCDEVLADRGDFPRRLHQPSLDPFAKTRVARNTAYPEESILQGFKMTSRSPQFRTCLAQAPAKLPLRGPSLRHRPAVEQVTITSKVSTKLL